MSGFGGGFGSSQQQPGFGLQQRSSSQPNFAGSGFGSSQNLSGFGSVPAPTQVPAPQGFGTTAASSPFGSAAAAPATTFGTSSNLAPFGAANNQSPSNFGGTAQPLGFGTSATPSFGNTNQPASAFPAAQQPNQQLAGTFGGAPPALQGFGGGSTQSSGFGGNNTLSFGGPPPGTGNSPPATGFGTTSFAPTTSSVASPFGGAPPTTSSNISFGVSANVIKSSDTSTSGFPISTAASSQFGSSNTTFPVTFGSSSSTAPPSFSATTDNEEMGDSDFNTDKSQAFGNPQQSSWSGRNDWGGSTPPPQHIPSAQDAPMSPTRGSFSPPVPEPVKKEESEEEKLARLKAKLHEKKKKLQERKKRKEAAASLRSAPPLEAFTQTSSLRTAPPLEAATSLNASAPSFTPGMSQAEKNKHRFAAPMVKTPKLPDGLRQKPTEARGDTDDGKDREDLENAVSLVGTCLHMCPDEELLRRQQENDIQLLEIPQPGTVHPDHWTLRETVVKRFRRSAADFKLNVPEWVRPPGVLESVCAYLEEWVMERDRQGPDPRFTQVASPPPLDVYLFIWDRTRMVRKDFILQNFVGTGGNCDARAVRCHERIARWHAMCEHQLSHIPDFVNKQSQQNIQELGQTMKTLNMYYDDSLGRSTLEVADEQGENKRGVHGCESPVVCGNAPRDFDGSLLANEGASLNRLIGSEAAMMSTRGTAEPEMRGLYMLLTMDNDGGSEVLNYAARLFRERPVVYNSKPVQLALRIYKAKKDYNYARFFSILRSPSTPYLFACIMFKYVQQMRKVAFRVMSKTFGAKKKDTNETFYDSYPLKRLVNLLCFEDEDEALAACKHYNMAVREKKADASGDKEKVIRWRASTYQESKDPEKGIVIPIQPRKMMRTIEAKLSGCTRLAVCRGDVSGDGASLVGSVAPLSAPVASSKERPSQLSQDQIEKQEKQQEAAARAVARRKEKLEEEQRRLKEAKVLAEKERKLKEAEARREAQELEKKKAEEERRLEALRGKKLEEELKRKRVEEEERMKREAEEARRAEAIAAEERRRQQVEAEAQRVAEKLEEERRQAEEAERERQRQAALELKAQEERKLKLRQEEEARKRREEEENRLRLLELQRKREEEERKRKAEIERKKALEWEKKINAARKLLFWRRWRLKVESRLQDERSREALGQIDPTYFTSRSVALGLLRDVRDASGHTEAGSTGTGATTECGIADYFVRRKLGHGEPLNVAELLTRSSVSKRSLVAEERTISGKSTILCKIAVMLPEVSGSEEDAKFCELVHDWLNAKLRYGQVAACRYGANVELRTVTVNGNIDTTNEPCDVALLVIPPRLKKKAAPGTQTFKHVTNRDIPMVVLNLDDGSESMPASLPRIAGGSGNNPEVVQLGETGDLETKLNMALEKSCLTALEDFCDGYPERAPSLQRVSLPHLAILCIRDAMWTAGYNQGPLADKRILSLARAAVTSLSFEMNSIERYIQNSHLSNWPPREFADGPNLLLTGYFSSNDHLPLSWRDNLMQDFVEPILTEIRGALNGSFRYVIENMLSRAPLDVRTDCEAMLDTKQFRRCLESALLWKESNAMSENLMPMGEHVYLPRGEAEKIREDAIKRLQDDEQTCGFSLSSYPADVSDRVVVNQSPGLLSLGQRRVHSPVATMSDEEFVKETPILQRLEQEKSTIEARDEEELEYFGLHADIVPFQRGVGDFDGEVSPARSPLNASRQKRDGEFYQVGDFLRKNKRSLDSVLGSPRVLGHGIKRRRAGKEHGLSQTRLESQDFTSKLEALLQGDATIDVDIGDTKLSRLLENEASPIDLP